MTFIVAKADMSNVEDIQKLNEKLFQHEIESGFDSNLDARWSYSDEGRMEIEDRVSSSDVSCSYVAKEGEKVIGYLVGRIMEEETGREDSQYADLEHMYIDDAYRGKGIGEQLVNQFKAWAQRKNLKLIKVNVSFRNTDAIKFYNKMGLTTVDITMVAKI